MSPAHDDTDGEPLLLGIDEGTTAVKAALFDRALEPLAEARRPVATSHPGPGLVEQDGQAVLEAVLDSVAEVLEAAPAKAAVFAGLAHQGESVLAWEAGEPQPLTPIVVWQDKRQEGLLERIDPTVPARSGLPLDPYFSAGKLAWLLSHDAAVARAAERGTLRLGTVDAFIADRLGGGFATDLSTASRTQLLALGGRDWDEQLLAAFGIRRRWLPRAGPTYGRLGRLRSGRWSHELQLSAQVVDQQAALAGSGAVRPGEAKATYGTGVFVLARTDRLARAEGLLPTVAWAAPGEDGGIGAVAYALDGGVFTAGALLEWLAGGLGLAADVPELTRAAAEAPDSGGVMVLPALAGLGAPWWQPGARGVIAGLHGATRPGQIARAALEGIAWRVADIVEAMAAHAPIETLHVDGGLSNDETLLQIQADALGLPLSVGRADTTVLGAAMLAGVGSGIFESVHQAAIGLGPVRTVLPRIGANEREQARRRWRGFLAGASVLP
ncbi:MAG: glycerol kinase [Solirubrobacteraceae bacterium]|nr:glycerol kinase [Solirubrobacteraceae bacterium]